VIVIDPLPIDTTVGTAAAINSRQTNIPTILLFMVLSLIC